MYSRILQDVLIRYTRFPAIAILGPRQSGKTTLAKETFPHYTYVTLEHEPSRTFAATDPEGFIAEHSQGKGLIIDEFQYVPHLTSYLQLEIDEHRRPGFFVLTGSQNFLAHNTVTQSLAGRVGILNLLPFSLGELQSNDILKPTFNEALFTGTYPRVYREQLPPEGFYLGYMQTYIEKGVRRLASVQDLRQFRQFVQLCAGRVGQLLNIDAIGSDAGMSFHKVKEWLSILEASYILFFLEPHSKKFNKRLTKSPKLYFYDTGLVCSLLRITDPDMLISHPLRGNLFENFVISDLAKQFYNRGLNPTVSFWRDRNGRYEIDAIIDKGAEHYPIEIKAGMTIGADFLKNLSFWNELSKTDPRRNTIIYGGTSIQKRLQGTVMPWQDCSSLVSSVFDT